MDEYIKVSKVTNKGHKKSIYLFTFTGDLEYIGNVTMHRDSVKESWESIYKNKESVNTYTKDGKLKLTGGYNLYKKLPPCPSQVVNKAKRKFKNQLKALFR